MLLFGDFAAAFQVGPRGFVAVLFSCWGGKPSRDPVGSSKPSRQINFDILTLSHIFCTVAVLLLNYLNAFRRKRIS